MNFYKKLRSKTTLTPLEVVNKMKEIAPIVNKNLTVEKYLQCEQGKKKMKGIRFNSFLETINSYNANPAETKVNELNNRQWFENFKQNYQEKFTEFNIKSQKHLSQLTGISQPTISEMLSSDRPVNKENIQILKEFFEDEMNIQEGEGKPYIKGLGNSSGKRLQISDKEYEELKNAFIKKAKESGKSYCELGKILHMDNTTIGKIIRGAYQSRGPKVIETMRKYVNGETIEFKSEPKEKEIDENQLREWKIVTQYVKNLKFNKGISLHTIAKQSGVSEGTLSCIINDKYEMTPTMLERLTDFYNKDNIPTKPLYFECEELKVEEEVTEDDISEVFEEETTTENVEETLNESDTDCEENEEPIYEDENITVVKGKLDDKDQCIVALKTIVENQERIIQNYETLIEVIRKYQDIA